ncbi:uncharacterized protein N7503_005719 [Penicillium pulvis]|uniref:uncharacterized protein n=1 Tax=Penicillium pulvis TaxID=1562058 RepID=UPI00254881E4|nr:uncharacterized protein N7503_005719 [Penicillium pulvis]KAJ5803269.1 hypothetical protein N7503_005719 [Penicillium pulvis]
MALSYPQGECFFKRSALKSAEGNRFDAEDEKQFYSTMLVEVIWNKEAYHGSKQCGKAPPHKRSKYKILMDKGVLLDENGKADISVGAHASSWQTMYGNYIHLPFNYGHYSQPSRRAQHELCTWGHRFKLRECGDAYESWFMFVPVPTSDEQWVFIDRLCSIRAIYIPVSYMASEKSQDLCTYLHVRFNNMADIELQYHKDETPGKFAEIFDFEPVDETTTTLTCHQEFGIENDVKTALGINVTKLVTTLIVPRQLRKQDAFSSGAIILVDSSLIPTKVASANHGLSVKWTVGNHKPHWLLNYLKNALVIVSGLVPVVGPILAMGAALGMEAIINPDEFMDELREQIPSVELAEGIIAEFKKLAGESKDNMNVKIAKIDQPSSTPAISFESSNDTDKASKQPVEKGVPDEATPAELAASTVSEVPSYKALSEAEYQTTVQKYVRNAFTEKVMGFSYHWKTDYDHFRKLLESPPEEHKDKTLDELIPLVKSKDMRERLEYFRKKEFTPEMEEEFRADEKAKIEKKLLSDAGYDTEFRDDDYNWAAKLQSAIARRQLKNSPGLGLPGMHVPLRMVQGMNYQITSDQRFGR